ncbi:hypothetical protein EBU58_00510 [bacterium]|nr:hypothetical protein [bacterium]
MSYSDEHWMRLAIETGRRARVWSSPNPAVGCAIVKSNEVLATGFTHPPGQAHAEVLTAGRVPGSFSTRPYRRHSISRRSMVKADCRLRRRQTAYRVGGKSVAAASETTATLFSGSAGIAPQVRA